MPSLVLGTAGHIDHGKSALIKALTGTDPDRLAEEKARGITIELGFARLELPSGRTMGVVDVPGHERFVRHMVAGATGIDAVLLVIAADDGIMPQTREHLAIIDLLGIERGVVAITKADLVEPDWLELVREEVAALLADTSIEGAPVVAVSSVTGEGLDELRAALDEVAEEAPSRQAALPMRLPVDRVFTIAGAGTVVTGTMWSGSARKDDAVQLYPTGREARIRGVQVHGESVAVAHAGQRVAINLAGIEKHEISRGDIVAAPGTLSVSERFDVRFTYLGVPGEDKPFETGTRVHVHHGTREVLGRVLLMDAQEMAPGTSGFAQVRLEEPLAPRYQDRFIVRSYSPTYTIGGGVILDVMPPRRTTLAPHERELLKSLLAGDLSGAAVGLLASRAIPMTSAEVASAIGVQRSVIADQLNAASLERLKAGGDTYFVTPEALETLTGAIDRELRAFHQEEPSATGIPTAALRDRVDKRLSPKVFDALLEHAREAGVAAVASGRVGHPEAAVTARAVEDRAVGELARILRSQGLTPGTTEELAAESGVELDVARRALLRLAEEGSVVRIGQGLHFAGEALDDARSRIVELLTAHPEGVTAAALRDALGVSRKYAIPLLEHFDAQGLTKREGDLRVLRRS